MDGTTMNCTLCVIHHREQLREFLRETETQRKYIEKELEKTAGPDFIDPMQVHSVEFKDRTPQIQNVINEYGSFIKRRREIHADLVSKQQRLLRMDASSQEALTLQKEIYELNQSLSVIDSENLRQLPVIPLVEQPSHDQAMPIDVSTWVVREFRMLFKILNNVLFQ